MAQTENRDAQAGSRRRRRSAAKRAAIVEAAAELFPERGYRSTSVNDVAARAGVAKQTVYEHFGDKQRLFTATVLETIDRVGAPFFDRLAALEAGEDPETRLAALARELALVARDRRLVDLRRVVIAEARSFPDLARAYAEHGPGRTVAVLAAELRRISEGGALEIDEVEAAAERFNWLVLAAPLNRAMFDPEYEPRGEELEGYANEAVRVFLAAYCRAS